MNLVHPMVKALSILCCLSPYSASASHFTIPINETLNVIIMRFGQCVFDIIETNFKLGSIVGFITAGLQNYTSKSLSNNSPDESLQKLMLNESWSIVVKQCQGYTSTRTKVSKQVHILCIYKCVSESISSYSNLNRFINI